MYVLNNQSRRNVRIHLSTKNDDGKAYDENTFQHIADGVWERGHALQCVCSNLNEKGFFSSQHRIDEWKDVELLSQITQVQSTC